MSKRHIINIILSMLVFFPLFTYSREPASLSEKFSATPVKNNQAGLYDETSKTKAGGVDIAPHLQFLAQVAQGLSRQHDKEKGNETCRLENNLQFQLQENSCYYCKNQKDQWIDCRGKIVDPERDIQFLTKACCYPEEIPQQARDELGALDSCGVLVQEKLGKASPGEKEEVKSCMTRSNHISKVSRQPGKQGVVPDRSEDRILPGARSF